MVPGAGAAAPPGVGPAAPAGPGGGAPPPGAAGILFKSDSTIAGGGGPGGPGAPPLGAFGILLLVVTGTAFGWLVSNTGLAALPGLPAPGTLLAVLGGGPAPFPAGSAATRAGLAPAVLEKLVVLVSTGAAAGSLSVTSVTILVVG
jgi:hypothetical protein